MLGPAELRELDEALNEERVESSADRRTPYLTPHFAMGMAMTRAVSGGVKRVAPAHPLHGKR